MLVNKILTIGINAVLILFSMYLLLNYFDVFFKRRRNFMSIGMCIGFVVWQFLITSLKLFSAYINIIITVIIVLATISVTYEGKFWNKCVIAIAFNAIWMLMEALCGYLPIVYTQAPIVAQFLGSTFSKIFLLFVIIALRRVFSNEKIKDLPTSYSIMLVLIPTGSIYIMNNILMLSYRVDAETNFQSAIAAFILLGINILIFYIYLKLTEDLQLQRMNAVYEQQLELCERHQRERELSVLQLRDTKHNMKNNLVSILAYAENGDYKKVIKFVNEIMDESGINALSVTNTGNIVVDSLVGYWYAVAQRLEIDFTINTSIPMKMPFKGADLCLILGNLLENAVEASGKPETNRYIRLRMKYDKSNLLIYVENSYRGSLLKGKDNKLKSTKVNSGNHGVGLDSINRTVKKYHGLVMVDDSVQERLLVKVVLYGQGV